MNSLNLIIFSYITTSIAVASTPDYSYSKLWYGNNLPKEQIKTWEHQARITRSLADKVASSVDCVVYINTTNNEINYKKCKARATLDGNDYIINIIIQNKARSGFDWYDISISDSLGIKETHPNQYQIVIDNFIDGKPYFIKPQSQPYDLIKELNKIL